MGDMSRHGRTLVCPLITHISATCILLLASCATVQDDLRAAQRQNTYAGYEEFTRKHPDSPYADYVKGQQERIEWESVKGSRNLAQLKSFVARYPNAAGAKSAIAEIEWDDATRIDTIDSYDNFLQSYSESGYAGKAGSALENSIRTWLSAILAAGGDAEQQYIAAKDQLNRITSTRGRALRARVEDMLASNVDRQRFERALKEGSRESIEAYVKSSGGQGGNVQEARKILDAYENVRVSGVCVRVSQRPEIFVDLSGVDCVWDPMTRGIDSPMECSHRERNMEPPTGKSFIIIRATVSSEWVGVPMVVVGNNGVRLETFDKYHMEKPKKIDAWASPQFVIGPVVAANRVEVEANVLAIVGPEDVRDGEIRIARNRYKVRTLVEKWKGGKETPPC